jgi:hypothetical protein
MSQAHRRGRSLLFWGLFLAFQIAGYVTPMYQTPQNPVPGYFGVFFLLPGSLVALTSYLDGNLLVLFAVISAINLATWGFVWRRMQRRANSPQAPVIQQTASSDI